MHSLPASFMFKFCKFLQLFQLRSLHTLQESWRWCSNTGSGILGQCLINAQNLMMRHCIRFDSLLAMSSTPPSSTKIKHWRVLLPHCPVNWVPSQKIWTGKEITSSVVAFWRGTHIRDTSIETLIPKLLIIQREYGGGHLSGSFLRHHILLSFTAFGVDLLHPISSDSSPQWL
jgi:hypothetical protein